MAPVAAGLWVQSLAWERPHATGAANKGKKKKKDFFLIDDLQQRKKEMDGETLALTASAWKEPMSFLLTFH